MSTNGCRSTKYSDGGPGWGSHEQREEMLHVLTINARVQKYNLTAANYGLNCSKYYVIRYNMYAPTQVDHKGIDHRVHTWLHVYVYQEVLIVIYNIQECA